MKKFFILLSALLISLQVNAKDFVLLSSDSKADFEGFDFTSNFQISSPSGYFNKDSLSILEPNEKGFRFIAYNPPKDKTSCYVISTPFPALFNQEGSGFIDNASSIKSIKITGRTNRPYDEVILLYRTEPNGRIHEIKMPQDFSQINSMEEFTLEYNNPLYNSNYKTRTPKAKSVLASNNSFIEFVGFKIRTNPPDALHEYSSFSIFYIKQITVDVDAAFTPQQLEERATIMEEFNIKEYEELRTKTSNKLKSISNLREIEASLME